MNEGIATASTVRNAALAHPANKRSAVSGSSGSYSIICSFHYSIIGFLGAGAKEGIWEHTFTILLPPTAATLCSLYENHQLRSTFTIRPPADRRSREAHPGLCYKVLRTRALQLLATSRHFLSSKTFIAKYLHM